LQGGLGVCPLFAQHAWIAASGSFGGFIAS
jgi:hypothetical protein